MSFRASSDIVNRKRSGRYVETSREIDTSTTKNSGKITFAYIVIGDKPESPDSRKHQGACGTVIWSASEKFKATPRPLAGYTYNVLFFWGDRKSSQNLLSGRSEPGEVAQCLDADDFMGHQAGFQEAALDL